MWLPNGGKYLMISLAILTQYRRVMDILPWHDLRLCKVSHGKNWNMVWKEKAWREHRENESNDWLHQNNTHAGLHRTSS